MSGKLAVKRKYFLKSTINKARLSRLSAKLIDLGIVAFFSLLFYPIGVLFALAYLSISDSMQNGQSIGKKCMGFSVISLEDGSPCSLKQSIVRNLPLLIPLAFSMVPLWGWLLSFFLGVPLTLLEIYLIYKLDSGHRLGDVMADTSVMGHDAGGVESKGQVSNKNKISYNV